MDLLQRPGAPENFGMNKGGVEKLCIYSMKRGKTGPMFTEDPWDVPYMLQLVVLK